MSIGASELGASVSSRERFLHDSQVASTLLVDDGQIRDDGGAMEVGRFRRQFEVCTVGGVGWAHARFQFGCIFLFKPTFHGFKAVIVPLDLVELQAVGRVTGDSVVLLATFTDGVH